MQQIFVTSGHPCCKIPVINLLALQTDEKSMLKDVKKVRKMAAERFSREIDVRFTPADFYWAIFEEITDEIPTLYSDNCPKELVQK